MDFYKPEEIKGLYGQIAPVYRVAFAGEPWFEVSKCAANGSNGQKCVGSFSSLPVGSMCESCGNRVTTPAYEKDELVAKFELLARTRPTSWYLEESEIGTTLAAVAWLATPSEIARERYPDVPAMKDWMTSLMGEYEIGWLDEVFANKSLKPSGNLRNFKAMCKGFALRLGVDILAYRTINERMVAAAKRDFKEKVNVFERNSMVPDRRDFIVINLGGNQL